MRSSRQASSAQNVVDLEAFRRERAQARESSMDAAMPASAGAVMVPVWVCWVPVWAPMQSL